MRKRERERERKRERERRRESERERERKNLCVYRLYIVCNIDLYDICKRKCIAFHMLACVCMCKCEKRQKMQ